MQGVTTALTWVRVNVAVVWWTSIGVVTFFSLCWWKLPAPHHFLVSIAILSTAFYSVFAMLVPSMLSSRGFRSGFASGVVVGLIIFAFLVSIIFSASYFNSAVGSSFIRVSLSDSAHRSFEYILHLHGLIFVSLFTAVDLVYMCQHSDEDVRRSFRRVIFLIDAPMLGAVAVTEIVVGPFMGSHQEIFSAGCVSFQFVVGSIQVLIMERSNFLHFAPEPAPLASSGPVVTGTHPFALPRGEKK